MKSTSTVLLSFFLLISLNPLSSQAQFAGGDGSEGDPYQITNLTELNEVRNYSEDGNHFILMNDIDARDTKNWNSGAGWEPIGLSAVFQATFDGNGHVIYGLYSYRPNQNYVGLFGLVSGGVIKNLGVVDAIIRGYEYTGIVAGYLYGSIENTFTSGEVTGYNHTGGIIGTLRDEGGSASVSYSYSHARTSSGNYGASGLVARQQGGTIINSYSTGTASAPNGGVGGLVGEQNSGTVTNSFWDTEHSGLATSDDGQATGKTTAEMQSSSSFTGAGWDFSSKWEIDGTYNSGYPIHKITNKYGGGSGISGDPYLIKNTFHLRNIYDNNTIYYQLVHDIDLDIYPYNSGKGWKPIGTNSSGQEFHGHFNGGGFKIKNLFINRPSEDFIGLFGSARHGSVRNVGFENVDITGKSYVSSIVGANYTLISQSYSTGSITANDHAGGLTGLVESWTSTGEISNSYSLATITATTASAGGLTGRFLSGNINNSYAVGLVSTPSNAGGIVGEYNSGTVENNVFWNTTTTGQLANPGGGVGKTLNQLKTISTFTDVGWDFTNVWEIVTGDSASYPYLRQTEQNPAPGKQFKIITYAGGQGSEADPFLISTPQQLDSVRYYLTSHFKLNANVNLDVAPFNTGEGWQPIGANSSGKEFSGTFDGDGYKIQNLFINRPSTDYVGFLGATKNAVVKNIGIEEADVTGKDYIGALVGINYSEIRNSYSTGSVKGENHTGGLIGGHETWGESIALVINSYSTASAHSLNSTAGGLLGRQISGTIEHSYAAGETFSLQKSGGLIGEKNSGTVSNSYWNNEFQCQNSSADGTELSVNQLKQHASFSDWDFTTVWNIDENSSFPYLRNNEQTSHPTSGQRTGIKFFNGGCGTESLPYQIATPTQLDSVRYFKDKHFIQTADIDLDLSPFNTGEGWNPIGAESNSYFRGNYNGGGFRILNLFINRSNNDFVGLFRMINSAPNLSNMRIDSAIVKGRDKVGIFAGYVSLSELSNINTSGSIEGRNDVGGLIGYSTRVEIDSAKSDVSITLDNYRGGGLIGLSDRSSITKSSSSGTVIGRTQIGGLIGVSTRNDIDSVYSDVSINATDSKGGGLIGHDDTSVLTNSYSLGEVTGRIETGGLVGFGYRTNISQSYSVSNVSINSGNLNGGFIGHAVSTSISNSYATGTITSNLYNFAGFAGRAHLGTITNSYSVGKVTGEHASAKGFLSVNSGATITNSYWSTENSGQSSSNGGIGLSIDQMKTQSLFTNWDFSNIWDINEGESLPYLKSNEQSPHPVPAILPQIFEGGKGTASKPYLIKSAIQLDSMRHFMSAHFVQIADIDLDVAPFNTGSGWTPIGTNSSGNEFAGHFDGNGFKISNLFINRNSTNFNGLFGATHSAELKNVILENVNITGDEYTGALVGINYSEVRNSYSTGTVSGLNHTGGLVGANETYNGSNGLVSNSYSSASATSSGYGAGSLVGRLISGNIEYSYGVGSVSAPSGNGGLIGEKNDGAVTNSYWNIETTGQETSLDGTGLTTLQMKQRSSFSGFDFANTWYIEEGSGYPMLQEQKHEELVINGNEGWRMLSSPLSGASFGSLLDTLWTQGFTGADVTTGSSNVYTWNESSQAFQSISDASSVPDVGTGFITYVYADDDNDGNAEGFPKKIDNSGTKFTGQANPSISFTNTGDLIKDGWNLVGNPYGTTINWNATHGWSKKNLDATFYVYSDTANNGNGSYLTWNGVTGTLEDGKIAPWQGFWVKANAASPELSINDSTKSSGGTLLKVSEPSTIKFAATSETMSSKAIVLFYNGADLDKDTYDAYKLKPLSSEYISLFSGFPLSVGEDETQLDINALPHELEDVINIPINLDLSHSDTSSTKTEINLTWDLKSLPTNWIITLHDQEQDKQYNLKEVSSVKFDVNHAKKAKNITNETPVFALQNGPKAVKAKSNNKNRFLLKVDPQNSVSNEWDNQLPEKVELSQNYPNPFNPTTSIGFGLPEKTKVRLEVFDVLGRKVATLINGESISAGRYTITFVAKNLASGMYIYRLQAGNSVITKKLTLIK